MHRTVPAAANVAASPRSRRRLFAEATGAPPLLRVGSAPNPLRGRPVKPQRSRPLHHLRTGKANGGCTPLMPKLAISLLSPFIEAAEGPRGRTLYAPPRQPTPVRAFGRKGPWMGLEKLDEGRQKPAPVMGDPVLPARTLIQKVVSGPGGPQDHRSTRGLIDVKASKILAYRCMPKYSSGHAGHESWGLPFDGR